VASRVAPANVNADVPLTQQDPGDSMHQALLIIMDGMVAGATSTLITHNPYSPTTEHGIRWRAGWLEARQSLLETIGGLPPPLAMQHPSFAKAANLRLRLAAERAAPF
jgi:hypothetical protein